jgi:hypothetical protein
MEFISLSNNIPLCYKAITNFPPNTTNRTPHLANTATGIADTGASNHFLRPTDPFDSCAQTSPPILVAQPDGTIMKSTQMGALALPNLPAAARPGHVLPALSHSSLISIGRICDADCTAMFEKTKVTILHNNKEILAGPRDYTTGLWRLPLEQNTVALQCNNVYESSTIAEQMQYLHASALSPVVST